MTIAGSATAPPVTVPLPSYRALVEFSKQCNASEKLVSALAGADVLEPLLLDRQAGSELLGIVDLWLKRLPLGAWAAGLFELRNHLERRA